MTSRTDKSLDEFLAKVDELQSLFKDLNAEDEETRRKAEQRADSLIKQNDNKVDNTGVNRTVINQKAFDDPAGGPVFTPDMDQNAFMQALEVDAQERYDRRKKHEAEALRIKDLGNEQFKLGNYDHALDFYNKALQEFKFNTVLWTNRAQTYFKLGQYENAINDCEWALKVFENCVKAHVHKGKALLALQRYDEAIDSYQRALKADPSKNNIINDYILEVERTRQAQSEEQAAQQFLEGGDAMAKGLLDILQRLQKPDQLSYFYIGGLNIITQLLVDNKEKALFRSQGGMQMTERHHHIARCMSASPRSLSQDELYVCESAVRCLTAAANGNEENQRLLLEIPSLPDQLLRFLRSQRKGCHRLRSAILTLLHELSQNATARSLITAKFDVAQLLESVFSTFNMQRQSGCSATSLLNNMALDKRFQELMRSDIDKNLLPAFESLMGDEEAELQVLTSCVSTVMNLCNDVHIRKKIAARKQTWEACEKSLKLHIPNISNNDHSEVVFAILGLLINMSFDSSYVLQPSAQQLCPVVCDAVLASQDKTQERALTYLGMLTALDPDTVPILHSKGLVSLFLQNICKADKESVHKSCIKCLTLCTQSSEDARQQVIDSKGLSPLVALLKIKDEVIHGNAALCLSHLVSMPKVAGKLAKTNIIQHLLVLARDGRRPAVQHNCAILIGKLATQDTRHLERLRELHGIEILHDVMKHVKH